MNKPMPDFFKFILYSLTQAKFLLNHPDILWDSGVYKPKCKKTVHTGEYMCMLFEISFSDKYPETPMIIISGSFHRLKNYGEHNHNKFSINELYDVVYTFCKNFQINPYLWRVSQIEIGLNILLPFEPNRSLFKRFKVLHGSGGSVIPATFTSKLRKLFDLGFEFNPSNQYALKCYGKNITKMLRVETSVSKMEVLKCDGLKHLKLTHLIDFLMPDKLEILFKVLVLDKFEKILVDEDIPEGLLKPKDFKFYKDAMSFDFWNELNPNDKAYRKKKIDQLMKSYGTYTIKEDIIQELKKELVNSLTTDDETIALFNEIMSLEFIVPKIEKFISDDYTIEGNLILKNNCIDKFNYQKKSNLKRKNFIDSIYKNLFKLLHVAKTFVKGSYKAASEFVYKNANTIANKKDNALNELKMIDIS